MKKQEKLQTSERPLSGAAARNLHGAASQAGGQGGREAGRKAGGQPVLPPLLHAAGQPALSHSVLGYSDKGPSLNHDFFRKIILQVGASHGPCHYR